MKILFIGNANSKYAGNSYFSYNTRIFNGLIRNGHYVYFFSDRDEVRAASTFRIRKLGQIAANRKLLEVANNFKPDAIILTHTALIQNDTLQEIKKRFPDIRIGQVNVDAVYTPHNIDNLKSRRNIVDASFITTGGPALKEFSSPGRPYYFIPNVTDSSIDTKQAFALDNPAYDLACFMHNDAPWDEVERLQLANGLASALPELKTCYRGFNGIPGVRGDDYLTLLGSCGMALNLSRKTVDGMPSTAETRYLYSSDRIAHIMSNGVMAFIPDAFGLKDLYTEKEVVFFSDLEDLISKTSFYKNNPAARQAIAKGGWQKAHNEFNETIITQYIIERLFQMPLSRDYAWPTEAFE